MDSLSSAGRSELMSKIRSKDTGPEMTVRSTVHKLGYRYKLHDSTLPGKPDLVFKSLGKIIFVNGCFWHQHKGCGRKPKSKLKFWNEKLDQNRKRDESNLRRLRRTGWKVLVIWECQLQQPRLGERLSTFLGA